MRKEEGVLARRMRKKYQTVIWWSRKKKGEEKCENQRDGMETFGAIRSHVEMEEKRRIETVDVKA